MRHQINGALAVLVIDVAVPRLNIFNTIDKHVHIWEQLILIKSALGHGFELLSRELEAVGSFKTIQKLVMVLLWKESV